jgi:hypothetical protein
MTQNVASWNDLALLQYFMNIDENTSFSSKSFPPISAGPQKYKHKVGQTNLLLEAFFN